MLVRLAEGREAQVFVRHNGDVVKVMRSVEQEPRVRREAPALQAADRALDMLRTLPDGDRLCHGDFHPANVLGTLGTPVIIDWGDAARGAPAADVARTWLLLSMGELPLGTPALMGALTAIGRGMMTRRYLTVYRRSTSGDLSRLDDWIFVRTAARFAEEIDDEFPKLLRLLEDRG
ncbi:MAG TPA: phosphotransferase [Acidimicrobiales bacterium]|nr:phosphotransferase [Acidimicrobiales bacterium]